MKHFMNNGKEYLKMTKEDMEFRQGRSKKQYENNAKAGLTASFLLLLTLAGIIIYGLLTTS
tara:strand:+ start:524 stop:706 length:183 start_codon:yes stop_codon:yes gene_type:complete